MSNFSPSAFVQNAGWDFNCIEATAAKGVSAVDVETIEAMGYGQTEVDELLAYCVSAVDEAKRVDPIYTYRTDAVHCDEEFSSADAAIAAAISQGEWADVDSNRESRDIANGAWLCVYADGIPSVIRGEMP